MGTAGSGGASRDRTGDLYNAIVALSQLSYGPTLEPERILAPRESVKTLIVYKSKSRCGTDSCTCGDQFPEEALAGMVNPFVVPSI